MDNAAVKAAVATVVDALDRQTDVVKVRVLDNLDSLVSDWKKGEAIDLQQLDRMVKRPLMQVATAMTQARIALLQSMRESPGGTNT